MPIYEYECSNRHHFELRQGFDADPVAFCPTCETPSRRVIRPVPVHFKGSGFYVNDYARGGSARDSASKEESTEPAPKTEAKAEVPSAPVEKSGKAEE